MGIHRSICTLAFALVLLASRVAPFVSSRAIFQWKHLFSTRNAAFLTAAAHRREIVDRSTLTLLEHVNLNVPAQNETVFGFFFDLLQCGLDPRKAQNLNSNGPSKTLWANAGRTQFHLPCGDVAQRIPGHVGLRYDSLEPLKTRIQDLHLQQNKTMLDGVLKSVRVGQDPGSKKEYIELVNGYGNRFVCREKEDPYSGTLWEDKNQPIVFVSIDDGLDLAQKMLDRFGRSSPRTECRGIDYVEFACPPGAAQSIALFYDSVFDATTNVVDTVDEKTGKPLKIAIVAIGNLDSVGRSDQSLLFRETTEAIPDYDGHHIALYVGETAADFEQAFANARLAGLVRVNPRFTDNATTLEGAREWKQFRMRDIVDMETGDVVMQLEHEIRSVEHESWLGSPSE